MCACRLEPGSKDVPGTASMPNAQISVPKFYCAIKKGGFYGEVVDSLAAAKSRPDEWGDQKNKDALQRRLGRGSRVQEPPQRSPRRPTLQLRKLCTFYSCWGRSIAFALALR